MLLAVVVHDRLPMKKAFAARYFAAAFVFFGYSGERLWM
jgi:hypothetical protein